MIVSKNAKLFTLLGYVGAPLALLFAFDMTIAMGYVFGGWKWLSHPDIPLSTIGGVIGMIVSFRNISAYGRWWEARIVWGSIVNNSRSFAREVISMISAPTADEEAGREVCGIQRKLVLLQVAYVHALRNHLRGLPPWEDLAALMHPEELDGLKKQQNVPLAIHQTIAALVAHCYRQGWIDDIRWSSLNRTLSSLMDSQGASERIKNTPMPRQYDMYIRHFIGIYCLLLPLGMVESLRLLTPLGSTLVGFIFLALDRIGRNLETPCENSIHDISLTAISRTIEINLKQMIGEKDIPEPVAPVNGVLW